MASDKEIRYCHCGNVQIRDGIGSTSSGSEVKVVCSDAVGCTDVLAVCVFDGVTEKQWECIVLYMLRNECRQAGRSSKFGRS